MVLRYWQKHMTTVGRIKLLALTKVKQEGKKKKWSSSGLITESLCMFKYLVTTL